MDVKTYTEKELRAWGERELIEYILKLQERFIELDLEEEELVRLLNGEQYNWNYNGIDIHIFMN